MAEKEKWSYKDYTDNTDTLNAGAKREQIASSKPSDFTYGNYVESDTVKQAKDSLNAQLAQKPNAYQSQWQRSINDTINKIMNRDKFSYDLNGDALYQQYKDQYVTQGKMAMMDTMGQAAALTGGYGSSYGQSVGQQTYQGYLQQLNDKVPELYQLALDQYNREGEDLYNQYSLYSDMDSKDYSKYRDTVSDYNAERDYLTNRYYNESEMDYGRYNDAYNRAYGQHRDSVADWQNELNRADSDYWNQKQFGYGQYSDNKNLAYQDYRNNIADSQWEQDFNEALRQYNEQFQYQKDRDAVADSQWEASMKYQKERDAVADSQWEKSYELSASSKQAVDETVAMEGLSFSDSEKLLAFKETEDWDAINNYIMSLGVSDAEKKHLMAIWTPEEYRTPKINDPAKYPKMTSSYVRGGGAGVRFNTMIDLKE